MFIETPEKIESKLMQFLIDGMKLILSIKRSYVVETLIILVILLLILEIVEILTEF